MCDKHSGVSALLPLWAKSPIGESGYYLPLVYHILDTAAVAKQILAREPESTLKLYAQDFGVSSEQAMGLVPALCGLHDLGKASPVFQGKWKEGGRRVKEAGFPFPPLYRSDVKSHHHQLVTYLTLRQILRDRGWKEGLARSVAEALGSHHGFRPTVASSSPRPLGKGPWEKARYDLVEIAFRVAGINSVPGNEALSGGGFIRLSGLANFADWIASNEEFFPYDRPLGAPREHFEESQRLASKALDKVGWFCRTPLLPAVPSFSEIFGFGVPRPLQRQVEKILEEVKKPSLIMVEAPTGEGKTEAAFYAHLKLQEGLAHRGMYVGLPTQATGNQMFDRTRGFLEKTSKRETPVDLQLLHGAALLKAEFQRMKVRLEEDSGESSVVACEWFTAKKRALLSEYGVGTVDQALLGVLNVKHYFVRMWGLGNRTVVFDEVHAYDAYTSALIERLLEWLGALGSSVVLMSATLPKEKRKSFVKAYGGDSIDLNGLYPRITVVTRGDKTKEISAFDVRTQQPVEIQPLPLDLEHVAEKVLEEVEEGGCCLCVMDTIARAQDLYVLLKEGTKRVDWPGELYIFHARYPANRRKALEEQVLRLFGKGGARPSGAILVATQVVEQSLDLDFDVMFSDLAPVDLLLQRAGRLHRHDRTRPSRHRKPRFFVMGLGEEPSELKEKLLASGIGKVYEPYLLIKSYGVLKEVSFWEYPGCYDGLIEAVYGKAWEPGEELKPLLEEEERKFFEKRDSYRLMAEKLAIPDPERFSKTSSPELEQIEDEDPAIHPSLRALTRLGEPSVDAVVLHRGQDGNLYLDADRKFKIDLEGPVGNYHRVLGIYMNRVSLSHPAVYHALKSPEHVPSSWRKEPLLLHLRPLIFENGKARFGDWVCEYSDELGIRIFKEG